jgi:hypothetical protein
VADNAQRHREEGGHEDGPVLVRQQVLLQPRIKRHKVIVDFFQLEYCMCCGASTVLNTKWCCLVGSTAPYCLKA